MQNIQTDKSSHISDAAYAFDPGLLADLTRALLPFLGPYSITTVKRAARSAENTHELLRQIASHIDDTAKREAFMKSGKRVTVDFAHKLADSVSETAAARSVNHLNDNSDVANSTNANVNSDGNQSDTRPSGPVTAELVLRGEAALAPIIGPLAGVLATRYAAVSKNSRDFFDRLAAHLRTPEERDSFFLSVRTGNGTWRSN